MLKGISNIFRRKPKVLGVDFHISREGILLSGPEPRAFVIGPGVVDPFESIHGKSSDQFTPAVYGEYIATSNAVFACVQLRSSLLSGLPLKLFRVGAGGSKEEIQTGDLFDLLRKVNPFWTLSRLLRMTEISLSLWGEAFWVLDRGEKGTLPPQEIWWARPDRMKVVPDASKYIKGFLYEPERAGDPLAFEPNEIVWFAYPNPLDEYEGLSPLAAARLAADTSRDAMRSNRSIFTQGMNPGGLLMPASDQIDISPEQAAELESLLEKRLKGVDKAHRMVVMRTKAEFMPWNLSPKDAEFINLLKWSLEDVARAYGVPLDLIGGQRTYENVAAAERAMWVRTMRPEANFISEEITEKLLPLFPGQADLAEFNFEDVEVLQEAEDAKWTRADGQIKAGAITINEWREDQGLKPVAWGDSWWAPFTVAPVKSSSAPVPPSEDEEEEEPVEAPRGRAAFGSAEHETAWLRFVRQTERQEDQFADLVRGLFERQKDSVLARLKGRTKRSPQDVADNPFNMSQWIKAFRAEARPAIGGIIEQSGNQALDALKLNTAFDVGRPEAIRFLEQRTQRFAKEVNNTTWVNLKDSLSEGQQAGESIAQLSQRVEDVMGSRIESDAETIARTEVIGANNGGTLEAWDQSEVVEAKEWLSALDDRTRTPPDSEFDHVGAHGEVVKLDEDFTRTGEELEFPGDGKGSAGNVINCRCTMVAVLSERAAIRLGEQALTQHAGEVALAAALKTDALAVASGNGKPKRTKQTIKRDSTGRIIEIDEEEL